MKNFNSNRLLSILTILLLIVNGITLTLLWSNKNNDNGLHRPMQRGPVFEFINRELNFTDSQKKEFEKLRKEHKEKQQPVMDSIRKAKDDFFGLLKQSSVPDSVVMAYNRRTGILMQTLDLINFKHFQQLRFICTPEQQIKFDKIVKQVNLMISGPRAHQGPPPAIHGDRLPPPPGEGDPEMGPPDGDHPGHPEKTTPPGDGE